VQLAMLAMVAAFGAELATGKTIFAQIQQAPLLIAATFVTIIVASVWFLSHIYVQPSKIMAEDFGYPPLDIQVPDSLFNSCKLSNQPDVAGIITLFLFHQEILFCQERKKTKVLAWSEGLCIVV